MKSLLRLTLVIALFTALFVNLQAYQCDTCSAEARVRPEAQRYFDQCSTYYTEKGFFSIGYSYRQDTISYHFEDISSLKTTQEFDPIRINQADGFCRYNWGDFYLRGTGDVGLVSSGETKKNTRIGNIDLLGHQGNIDGSVVVDMSAGLGYQYELNFFKFVPLFGYSWSYQDIKTSKLEIDNDFINELSPGTRIDGLKESQVLNWQGPWIGLDFYYAEYRGWDLYACCEYHWAEITGKYKTSRGSIADISFDELERHERGCGQGFIGTAAIMFDVCSCWRGFFSGTYQAWNLDHGYGKDEDRDLFQITKLDWTSWKLTLGLSWVF